jgi:DeoR family transcriptional regulator, aga operon transcriptional repressor
VFPGGNLDSISLIERIEETRSHGSASFRKIADFIVTRPEVFMEKTVRELAQATQVSEPTLIRFCRHYGCSGIPDFRIQLAMGLAWRNASTQSEFFEPSIDDKNLVNRHVKKLIADRAAMLARDDACVILDSGSTVELMSEGLRDAKSMTVLTTGLNLVQALRRSTQHKIILPGGTFRPESMSLVGRAVESFIGTMHFDTAYIGCDSIDPVNGLSTFNEDEAHQTAAMIAASDRVVVLADSSKFRSPALHRICAINQIDIVISDACLLTETREAILAQGVELVCVELL